MKEFSLEEHLKNPDREVVTRDGEPVRIIYTRWKSKSMSILALIGDDEEVIGYQPDGRAIYLNEKFDLFFADEDKCKHEGWMNLYKKDFGLVQGGEVYNSEEAAKKIAAGDEDYITTIKVEWEEE